MDQYNRIEEFLTTIINLFASEFSNHAILRGGMVLRLLDSPRLTNDLDYLFVPYRSKKEVLPQILEVLNSIADVTVSYSMNSKCLRFKISKKDLVVQVEVKVDSDCKVEVISTAALSKLYNQVPRIINVMAYDVAMANKLAAWYDRALIRDLYDIYLFINMGISPDEQILESRLKKTNFSKVQQNKSKPKSIGIAKFYEFLKEEVKSLSAQDVQSELAGILPHIELLGLELKIKGAILGKF